MEQLANFLADFLLDRKNFDEAEWPLMLKEYTELITEGIEKYKIHLSVDEPKTVQWVMIEKNLITALERMQSPKPEQYKICAYPEYNMNIGCDDQCPCHGDCAIPNKKNEKSCLMSSNSHLVRGLKMKCVNCKFILVCTDRANRHCKECLLFNLKSQGKCEEPGYSTKADNNACDRFKLNVLVDGICPAYHKHPIAPGHETCVDCIQACKLKYKCQCGHFFNEPSIIDPYGSSINPRCPKCNSENFIEY